MKIINYDLSDVNVISTRSNNTLYFRSEFLGGKNSEDSFEVNFQHFTDKDGLYLFLHTQYTRACQFYNSTEIGKAPGHWWQFISTIHNILPAKNYTTSYS